MAAPSTRLRQTSDNLIVYEVLRYKTAPVETPPELYSKFELAREAYKISLPN